MNVNFFRMLGLASILSISASASITTIISSGSGTAQNPAANGSVVTNAPGQQQYNTGFITTGMNTADRTAATNAGIANKKR